MDVAALISGLSEAVFPAKCIGCSIRGTPLCTTCRRELPRLPNNVCARCAALRGTSRGACSECARLSPYLGRIYVPFAYEGAIRSAVLTLKFRSGRYLAPTMGDLLRTELRSRPIRAELVVPVPLAPSRRRKRGYNQAVLLAEPVAGMIGEVPCREVLTRAERPAQRTLDSDARLRNLLGTVSCTDAVAVRGRHVVLVDDVVTTGATLSACAEALAGAGANRISAVAFARDL
jgi:ComF family protein